LINFLNFKFLFIRASERVELSAMIVAIARFFVITFKVLLHLTFLSFKYYI